MYRIKNDKRTQRSARLLETGLLTCLRTHNFNDIGICDICNACGVSRTTFYRLFDTPTDVLSYACDSLAEESVQIYDKSPVMKRKDLFIEFFQLLMDHCDLLEAIVKCDRREVLENAFLRFYYMRSDSRGKSGKHVEDAYFAAISCSVITAMLFRWEKGGKKETAEDVYNIYSRFIANESRKLADGARQ